MTLTLEKSLHNREHMIASVQEEIIGPIRIRDNFLPFNPIGSTVFQSREEFYTPHYWNVGDKKEEILQRESPTQRYVSGQLFPIGSRAEEIVSVDTLSMNEEEVENDTELDGLLDIPEDMETTESNGDIELFPQRSDFLPSSMGLTFCVAKSVSVLNILVAGGVYTPHNVKVLGDSRAYTWWLRESVSGHLSLRIPELAKARETNYKIDMFNLKMEQINYLNLEIQVRLREVAESYIITASLTNRSKAGTLRRDQLILFQSEMSIATKEADCFSPYPKRFEITDDVPEDEASAELLYRKEAVYAFGHGCSADWDQHAEQVSRIRTTFMPSYETMSMTPDVETAAGPLKIRMSDLAGLSSKKHPSLLLQPLIDGYSNWIKNKQSEVIRLPAALQRAAKKHMEHCQESLHRMQKGLELLQDPVNLRAFQLANSAILLQQENGNQKRTGSVQDQKLMFSKDARDVIKDESHLKSAKNYWRAFQIAFFLMSIESLADDQSDARDIVDLIWFPTGGGKTEAYLGVAAFQMILRRLRNPLDAGVDIMMRYTLRLLTADQFQRSSRLICALEHLRRKNPDLGDTPYSIGIWVGSKTTPNSNTTAKNMLNRLEKNKKGAQSFIVHNCPWCGASLGFYPQQKSKKAIHVGYKIENDKLVVHCPDNKCQFHDELPIYIVDETIYNKRPTFLIGTIDKFVQLVWEPRARSLFGIDKNGERFVSPPSLIIQDELHLISGPLGTLAGLFEALVEELCLKEGDRNKLIKPKIIAATATIKQFEEQARALFGRSQARLFPSPGLEHDDSFFSRPARDENNNLMPGRKYIGVYTTTVRIMMAQVMTFSAILQGTSELDEQERDPFWTLLAFYNTLRELGGGLTLAQTDIPQYSKAISMRKGVTNQTRFLNNVLELTSRKQSDEISKTIDDLKTAHNAESKSQKAIDLCLASNIIEVGVDINRLSIMTIVGQPKMTAQYIQVSGRVGRQWAERPGVIFTLYSNTKSRDKSHFEHFREYHQRLYAQVESTSVTPFSDSCLDRGLQAVVIGYMRQALNHNIARTPDWEEIISHLETHILPFYNRLVQRANLIDPEQTEELKKRFRTVLKRLETGGYTAWKVDSKMNGYMYPAGTTIPIALRKGANSMINSMRNVDAECRGLIVSVYNSETKEEKSSWEGLFE